MAEQKDTRYCPPHQHDPLSFLLVSRVWVEKPLIALHEEEMPSQRSSTASSAVTSCETPCVYLVPSRDACHGRSAEEDKTVCALPSPENPLTDHLKVLPRLHVVTVATHADGYFTSLVYSSLLLQSGLRVLAWGEKWRGFGMKIVQLVEYCRQLPPRDVVMLVDGFDTVLLQPNEIIVRKFLEFGGRIVLTGESRSSSFFASVSLMFHNCVFKSAQSKMWPKLLPYANKEANVRLLNAGGIIGYVEDIVNLCKDVKDSWNDQRFFSEVFMMEPHKRVTIDANGTIFSLYGSRKEFKILSYSEAEKEAQHVVPYFPDDPQWNEEAARKRSPAPNFQQSALRGVLMNAVTHETPCVLHMYCRSNADHLIKALGLPKGEKILNLWNLTWYAYFSLHGTLLNVSKKGETQWHMPYVIAFVSAVACGVGAAGLLLNALVYLFSLSLLEALLSNLQRGAVGLLGPQALSHLHMDNNSPQCTGEKDVQQGIIVHSSSWALALQLLLHLCLLPAPILLRVVDGLVNTIVFLLPVFVGFLLAGSLVLGTFVHLHGNFGDDEQLSAATGRVGARGVVKSKTANDESALLLLN